MHWWKTSLMKKHFSIRTTFFPKICPIISPCEYLTKDRPSFKATVIGFLGWSQTDGFHCTSKYPQTSMCRVKSQRWKMSTILSHALSPNITPHTLTKFQRRRTVNCKLTMDTIICNKLHWKILLFFFLFSLSLSLFFFFSFFSFFLFFLFLFSEEDRRKGKREKITITVVQQPWWGVRTLA